MKIIISPAKNMKTEEDIAAESLPVFLDKSAEIKNALSAMSYAELKALWGCNAKLAELNYDRLKRMDLNSCLSPALLAYDGIQYKYMAPGAFSDECFAWIKEHLRILSGFYGILRPMDGVVSYRLEMQAKLSVGGSRDLYDFWGDSLYRELTKDDNTILNLASKEYSKCVETYAGAGDRVIDFVFAEESGGKLVQKGTLAKMARGEMVRFLAENNASKPEDAKGFARLGFRFSGEKSDGSSYVFIKK